MERKVYLILTDTGTLFTRMIKLYTKKTYNHASLSFDPHFSEIYSFGRKKPRNPFIGGFVKESMHTGLLKQANCVIYCCPISETQYQKMNHFIREIEERKEHYRYNLIGLFAIPLNKTINREYAYFCSQFVASILKEGHVIEFTKHTSHVTPHDLQQAPHFQLFYQGNVADYFAAADIGRTVDSTASRTETMRILRKKLWSACSFFLGV